MHIQESCMIHCGWCSAADITKVLMCCAWDCFKVVKEIKARKRMWTWAAVHCYPSNAESTETRIIDPLLTAWWWMHHKKKSTQPQTAFMKVQINSNLQQFLFLTQCFYQAAEKRKLYSFCLAKEMSLFVWDPRQNTWNEMNGNSEQS